MSDFDLGRFLEDNPAWKVCPDLLVSPPSPEELLNEWPGMDRQVVDRC